MGAKGARVSYAVSPGSAKHVSAFPFPTGKPEAQPLPGWMPVLASWVFNPDGHLDLSMLRLFPVPPLLGSSVSVGSLPSEAGKAASLCLSSHR